MKKSLSIRHNDKMSAHNVQIFALLEGLFKILNVVVYRLHRATNKLCTPNGQLPDIRQFRLEIYETSKM